MSTPTPRPAPSHSPLLAVGLLSGSGLFLEVALTRLLSALYYPPYVFAVLSLAVLGIGLGAGVASWRPALRRTGRVPLYAALAGLATLLLVVVAVLTASLDARPLMVVLLVLPYACIGLALATLFGAYAPSSPQLYRTDLISAGAGVMLAIPALNLIGPINGLLLAAALLALAGLATAWPRRPRLPTAGTALALALLLSNAALGWLDVSMGTLDSAKPIVEGLAGGGRLVESRWDAFARTDLVQPAGGGPYRLYIDGAAASVMPPEGESDLLLGDIGLFPFATAQPERVFIIGPGGGLDVWFARLAGAQAIVAAEVNPASVALVRDYAAYNGGLYDAPEVRVVVDEGRSVLRREQATYDLINLSQVVTLAAERSGYTLTENTVYTVEAFEDYLAHLSADGLIAIKLYDEATLTRALSTALAAFREQGLTDAQGLSHVIALLDARADSPIPLLLVRKSAYRPDEALELGAVARQVGFRPLFLPGVLADPPLDGVEAGTVAFDEIVASADGDISPTGDDRPFFYQFERGVPKTLQPLLWGLAAVVAVGWVMLAAGQRRVSPRALRRAPLYFAALGAGYMLVEVAVIQQVRLFLGHPTLAVTTALAVLLIAGGLGSGLAGRLGRNGGAGGSAVPVAPALAAALLVLVWSLAWPLASRTLLAAPLPLRLLAVIAALAPLAFVMGMPFPLGLRWVGRGSSQPVALGWAVNGVMTVVGSALAVTLAILAGFSRVLWAGAAVYLLAALVARFLRVPQAAGEQAGPGSAARTELLEEEVQASGAQDQRAPASG